MWKNKKTNAMRMLDRAKIKYEVHSFEVPEEHLSGQEVAELIQANVKTVFKTLVQKIQNMNILYLLSQ